MGLTVGGRILDRKNVLQNKGQYGGWYLMLWGMILLRGVLKGIIGTQTSKDYRYMLSTFAVPVCTMF